MPAYVVYGWAVFSTTQRRNRVVTRATQVATDNGFTPSSRVKGYPPGVTSINYTATATGDGMTAGNTYPAAQICYEHSNQELVAQAELLIQGEMETQGWLYGNFGTWADFSA